MKRIAHTRLIALLISALITLNGFTDNIDEKSFNTCSRLRGDKYEKLRDLLLLKGDALKPMLKNKLKSKDLDKRLLAEAMIHYLDNPEKVKAWRTYFRDKKGFNWDQLINRVDLEKTTDLSFSSPYMKISTLNLEYLQTHQTEKVIPDCITADLFWEGGYGHNDDMWKIWHSTLHFALFPNHDMASIIWGGTYSLHNNSELLYREGLVKLGKHPRYMQTLEHTLMLLNHLETDKKFKFTDAFREIEMKFRISLYVLSRLKNDKANALMLKILFHKNNYTIYPDDELPDTRNIKSMVKRWYKGQRIRIMPIIEALSYRRSEQNLSHLVHFMLICGKSKKLATYWKIRYWIVKSYGKQALPLLQELHNSYAHDWQKIVIKATMAEIDARNTEQNSVAKLRESIFLEPTIKRLLELHKQTGESIASRLVKTYEYPPDKHEAKKIKVLGELGDPEAIPYLTKIISEAHEEHIWYVAQKLKVKLPYSFPKDISPYWQLCVEKSNELGYAGLLDTREIRIMGNWLVSQKLTVADLAIRAIADINGENAKKVLRKISDFPAFTVQAESMLLAMDQKHDLLKQRLSSPKVGVREEAALALWKLNYQEATPHLLRAAACRRLSQFTEWKEYAASSKNLKQALIEMGESENIREKVLAKYMLLEMQEPEKVSMYHTILNRKAGFIRSWHVWGIDKVQRSGEAWVRTDETLTPVKEIIQSLSIKKSSTLHSRRPDSRLDESFIPLLEYTAIFEHDNVCSGIAAFALGKFKKKSSIAVLVEAFSTGTIHRSSPAAMALVQFGKEGCELASRVPAPSSKEWGVKNSVIAHLAAVYVMSKNEDFRAVEHIIKGLEALLKHRDLTMWDFKAEGYIKAAALYHDERLIKPLAEFMKIPRYSSLKSKILPILSKYNKPESADYYLQQLGNGKLYRTRAEAKNNNINVTKLPYFSCSSTFKPATQALSQLLKERTFEYLKDKYQTTSSIELKCSILLAMGELSNPTEKSVSRKIEQNNNVFITEKESKKLAATMREKAFPFIVEKLTENSEFIAIMASRSLANWGQGTKYKHPVYRSRYIWKNGDRRAVPILNKWVEKKGKEGTGDSVLEYLAYWGDKRSGQLIFKLYKEGHRSKGIIECIEVLRPPGAIELLYEQMLKGDRHVRIDNLKYMGDDGIKALVKLLRHTKMTSKKKVSIAVTLIETKHGGILTKQKYEIPVKLYHETVLPAIVDTVLELINHGKQKIQYGDKPKSPKEEGRLYSYGIRRLVNDLEKSSPSGAKKLAKHILKMQYPETMLPWAHKLSTKPSASP